MDEIEVIEEIDIAGKGAPAAQSVGVRSARGKRGERARSGLAARAQALEVNLRRAMRRGGVKMEKR